MPQASPNRSTNRPAWIAGISPELRARLQLDDLAWPDAGSRGGRDQRACAFRRRLAMAAVIVLAQVAIGALAFGSTTIAAGAAYLIVLVAAAALVFWGAP